MRQGNFFVFYTLLTVLVLSCSPPQNPSDGKQTVSISADTLATHSESMINTTDTMASGTFIKKDSSIVNKDLEGIATEILTLLKKKDYQNLGNYLEPKGQLMFSPYGHISKQEAVRFSADDLEHVNNVKILRWGTYDGSGETISLNIDQYFDKFVYDSRFLEDGTMSINKIQGKGNTIINIAQVFPGSDFVEYYIPGKNPDYRGMDWASLRLIFKKSGSQYYLQAIVHDGWTI